MKTKALRISIVLNVIFLICAYLLFSDYKKHLEPLIFERMTYKLNKIKTVHLLGRSYNSMNIIKDDGKHHFFVTKDLTSVNNNISQIQLDLVHDIVVIYANNQKETFSINEITLH